MALCTGEVPLTAKVDEEMREFIDGEAARCGVSRAELIRRVFDDFKQSREGGLECPHCQKEVHLNPCP